MPAWAWGVIVGIVVVAVIAAAMIKVLGAKKKAGEAIGWLDVALAFAQGIDDAKELVPAEAKEKMMGAIKGAAVSSGKQGEIDAFLRQFGFNKPKSNS